MTHIRCEAFKAKAAAIIKDVEIIELALIYLDAMGETFSASGQTYVADAREAVARIREELDPK